MGLEPSHQFLPPPVVIEIIRSARTFVGPLLQNLGLAVSTTEFTFGDSLWSELEHNGLADFEIEHFYDVPAERGLAIRDPKSQYLVNATHSDLPEGSARDLVMTNSEHELQDLLRAIGPVSGGRKTDLAIRIQQLSVLEDELLDPGEVSLSWAVPTTSVRDPRYLNLRRRGWEELKDECRSRGLFVEGCKHDMVVRLMEAEDETSPGGYRRSTFGRPYFSFRRGMILSASGVLFLVLVHWSRHGVMVMFTGVPFHTATNPSRTNNAAIKILPPDGSSATWRVVWDRTTFNLQTEGQADILCSNLRGRS